MALALIQAGADTEATNSDGDTPLILAADNSHESLALALVKLGADLEAKDQDGDTPLLLAADYGLQVPYILHFEPSLDALS